MKVWTTFAVAALAVIAAGGWLLSLMFPTERRAVWWSGGVAYAVQLVAFALARRFRGPNVMVGWGVGVLLRLGTLAVYGFVVVPQLKIAATPAMVSLAALLFASTIVEPWLLAK